jgi:hypothetical protein
MERPVVVAEHVAQFGRVGSWGEQVLGKIASKNVGDYYVFFPKSCAGAGGI